MRSANRDRPDHRGTALRAVTAVLLIGILLIVPASANTATYYIAENGTSFSAEITLVNQSGYLLISPGVIGEGAELKVTNLTLTAENGTVVNTTKKSSTQIAFPEGNYTLVYDAPLDGYLMYAQYLSPFNTTVFLPAGFHTNNVLLGPVSNGGVTYNLKKDRVQLHNLGIIADGTQYETVVVWTDRQEIQMRFYPASYEKYFVICMGLWFILFCAVGYRYWRLKRKANQYF
ncbi:DUF5803 family protein [Methanocorpusculum sp. MG]|uniref:DUF5803 family protein n=1 Tax=Methanocorpusculum petauri TaxID=3002863 RepID=A0ABT4IHS9_9EURY|nr:DUF5803 family protein [Methanocorpusculum petauri]MCZ0860802.1 DUF5803 family protein [Methanocorpusculum petauri]